MNILYLKIKNKTILQHIFLICIMCMIIFYFYYGNHYLVEMDGDIAGYIYAPFANIAHALNNGELLLWDPHLNGGQPGLHPLNQVFYPITLMLCKLLFDTENGVLSFTIITVYSYIHTVISSIGIYLTLQELGLKKLQAFFISVIGACSGTALFGIISLHAFYAAIAWTPLLIFTTIKMVKKIEVLNIYTIITGIICGLIFLCGCNQGGLLALLSYIFIFLAYLYEYRRDLKKIKRLLQVFFLAGLLGILIGLVQIIPTLYNLSNSYRFIPEYGFTENGFKMPFEAFVKHSHSGGDIINQLIYNSNGIGIGIILFLLNIMGYFSKVNDNTAIFNFSKLYSIFVLFSSMSLFGVSNILYYIPMYNSIRELYLYCLILFIPVSINAGLGLKNFISLAEEKLKKQKINTYFYNANLMIFIMLYTLFYYYNPINYRFNLAVLGTLFLMYLYLLYKKNRIGNFIFNLSSLLLITGMCIVNTDVVKKNFNIGKFSTKSANEQIYKVMDSIKKIYEDDGYPQNSDPYRVCSYSANQPFTSNAMAMLGYYQASAYWNPVEKRVMDAYQYLSLNKLATIRNIKYIATSENDETSNAIKAAGFELDNKVFGIYSNNDIATTSTIDLYSGNFRNGLAWFVYDFIEYDDSWDKYDLFNIINGTIDLKKTALVNMDSVEKNLPKTNNNIAKSKVDVIEYNTNNIKIQCTTDMPGILQLAEPYYPGWQVYVDGKKADIVEINYFQRGAIVEAGDHFVEFKYMPIEIVICLVISLLSTVFSLVFIFKLKRKSKIKF